MAMPGVNPLFVYMSPSSNLRKMKALKFIFFLVTVCLLTGCKPEFTVEFDLEQDVNTTCRLVYYASSSKQGMVMEPVAGIENGKGKVIAPTKYPSIVFLFQTSSSVPSAIFYAERGDKIKITGKGSNPMDWEIKGNSLSEEWSEWRLANKDAIMRGGKDLNEAIGKYVEKNPSSKLSAALLILQYSRRDDEEGFMKLFNSLKPGATSDKQLMNALSVADMPGGELEAGGNLSTMVLSAPSGNADTLRFNRGVASIVIFRDSRNRDFLGEESDSLRSLLKSYPDSTSRMIARISFDPDSMSWINSLRTDSLKNIAKGWMPHGLADSTAIALGVRRTPYYVVADGKGKRIYGGSDLREAVEKFRKTVGKK